MAEGTATFVPTWAGGPPADANQASQSGTTVFNDSTGAPIGPGTWDYGPGGWNRTS